MKKSILSNEFTDGIWNVDIKEPSAKDVLEDKIQRMKNKVDRYKKLLKSIKWKTISKDEEQSLLVIFNEIKP